MNLLFFCCCFLFLAIQVLLIEGPHMRDGAGDNLVVPAERTGSSHSTSHQDIHGIYGKTSGGNRIEYLTEDNDPAYFRSRNLGHGRTGLAHNDEAKKIQPTAYTYWRYTPEVYWALTNIEAFASLMVTYKGHDDRQYYHPTYYGYNDKMIDEALGMHQVTAPLSTKDKPYLQICCSVLVKLVESDTEGISEAYCGHPICYAATKVMAYWSSWGQWTCHPPPIRGQPSESWSKHLCMKLRIKQ